MKHETIPSDQVITITPDLEIKRRKLCPLQISGSHDSNIQIRSWGSDIEGNPTEIHFSGNPSKFFQGHNIFGSDDLNHLLIDLSEKIFKAIGIRPTDDERKSIEEGEARLTMVDINYSFELPSKSDVLAWIKAASIKAKSRHGTTPRLRGNTLYFGQHSKRWAFKAYSKGHEIEAKGHRLPLDLAFTPLAEWAQNKLRLELRLLSKELEKRELQYAKNWDLSTPQTIFDDYITRINMNEQIALTDNQVHKLPQALKAAYLLWQQGFNVQDHIPKSSFYRHKKQLIDHYGIDISLPKDSSESTNVVPLIRVLEAKPATIPDWAFDLDLIHHSAA